MQKAVAILFSICLITSLNLDYATAEEIDIPNVGSIVIPEIMEVSDLLRNKAVRDYVYDKMNVEPKSTEGLVKNLVVKQKGMKLYSRIIVETIPGGPGDYEQIDSKYTVTSEEMKGIEKMVKSSFESEFKSTPLKILQWYPFKLVDINGMRALHFLFKRQLNNNPPVLAKYYLFQNYDRAIRLTASYRLDEADIWQEVIQESIDSFHIVPYGFEKNYENKNDSINKFDLIRHLATKRVQNDPILSKSVDITTLPDNILIGLPEATIVTIVETYVQLKRQGLRDKEIFEAIENHRASLGIAGTLPSQLNLPNYIKYRVRLEHSHGRAIGDNFIDEAIKEARKTFGR